MSNASSTWTNPLSLVLLFLGLLWIFSIVKSCNKMDSSTADPITTQIESPIPNYALLPEVNCPLKVSGSDEGLASILLRQYFRIDSLNRFEEAIWRPDPTLDAIFAKQYEGDWETYVECIQTLKESANGVSEKIAILSSNFLDNDCSACAPFIGYIRFSINQDDSSTIVILDAKRALFNFGAYGAIGDQISLVQLGELQTLAFSTMYNNAGQTQGHTTIYELENFNPILTVDNYSSNGGTEEETLYEKKGDLYTKDNGANQLPKLALYQYTKLLSGNQEKAPSPEIIYYEYETDSLRYIKSER